MLKRFTQLGLAAFLTTALTAGTAIAQDDPCSDEFGDDMENPCGDDMGDDMGDDAMGDDAMGDDAAADDAAGDDAAAGDDMAAAAGPNVLKAAGSITIEGAVEINLSKDAVAKPFSIAPDVWYGVSDKLSAGLVHSAYGLTGAWLGFGNGLCLSGEENGCAKFYNNLGLRALFGLSTSPTMALAADGGIIVNNLSEGTFSLRAGVKGAWQSGKLVVDFNPALHIGLTDREGGVSGAAIAFPNKESLLIPVSVGFAVNPKLVVGVQSGLNVILLSEAGDTIAIPLVLGGRYEVSEKLGVGATVGFPAIAGSEFTSSSDARGLNLWASFAL